MNKQQVTSTGIDWKLFCRRIINNPRQTVIHITKNELKIFSKLFVNSIRMANSSHAGQSSSHGGVRMVGIPIPASQILKNLKQKHMQQSSKSLIEKPKSAQIGSPEDKVIKLAVNYQSVPHNYALKPPTPKTSPQTILKKEIIDEPTYREEKFDAKDVRDDHLLYSPTGREDSDYIQIDIKDICPPSRTSSSCRISVKYSQKKERNDDFDDADDLSVDSEDTKYIFEDDFEDASFMAIDTKDERDQCHSENSKNQSRDKDMHDKDIKIDMDNLRLKYDYDSKLPAINDGIHGDQDAIYKMSGIDRVRSLGGHIMSPENYVENREKTDDRGCEESERNNLSKGPASSGI